MDENRTRRAIGPVVVAVDGGDDGARALRYGVREARRDGRRLRLVHVAQESVPMAPMLPAYAGEALLEVARAVLADAKAQADDLADDEVDVEAVLERGPRVPAILAHVRDASLVVLGQRSSTLKRFFTGSTTTGVAARATCPVVCVPESWEAGLLHERVVAGVDGSPASAYVLDAAARTAEALGAGLTVLHAWRPAGDYDAVIGGRVLADRWWSEANRGLAELSAGIVSEYPDVQVHRSLAYEPPRLALVEASGAADLVVIGRTGWGAPFGLSLGSVARTLIRAARCPVQIVPVPVHDDEDRDRAAALAAQAALAAGGDQVMV